MGFCDVANQVHEPDLKALGLAAQVSRLINTTVQSSSQDKAQSNYKLRHQLLFELTRMQPQTRERKLSRILHTLNGEGSQRKERQGAGTGAYYHWARYPVAAGGCLECNSKFERILSEEQRRVCCVSVSG